MFKELTVSRYLGILLCLGILVGCGKAVSPVSQRIAVGDLAPQFMLPDINSNQQVNSSKVIESSNAVVIIIWSMACPSCREALVDCQHVYQKYGPAGVSFVGINFDMENLSGVRAFLLAEGIEFMTVWDNGGKVTRAYKALDYTFSIFVVDRQGSISFAQYDHPPDLAALLSRALDEMLARESD